MKNAMMEKKITTRELSQKTGIDPGRISDLKSHRAEPTGPEVYKLVRILGNKIRFAGSDEADENMKKLEAMMAGMEKAYEEICRRGYGKGNGVARDTMPCPVCGDTLYFRVANCNGHVHAKCKTDGCLAWMQ